MNNREAMRSRRLARERIGVLALASTVCVGIGAIGATLPIQAGSNATGDGLPELAIAPAIYPSSARTDDSSSSPSPMTPGHSHPNALNPNPTETITQHTAPAALSSNSPAIPLAYQATVDRFLDRLNARGFPRRHQGVMFVSLEGVELAGHQQGLALPAASITKLATSLAALEIWGPEHRFTTRVYTTGEVRDRILHGDLIVMGSGDPYFVWEDSFEIASQIARMGIRHITGDFKVVGSFHMNYRTDRDRSAELLRWGMHQSLWPQAARTQYIKWAIQHPLAPIPNLSFSGDIIAAPAFASGSLPDDASLLVEHESAPLTTILKILNSYSNNAMAHILAQQMGGISAVRATVAPWVPSGEMQVETASGLGRGNQFSSRAVVELLTALDARATSAGLQLEDWLPVIGDDPGTLENRTAPPGTTAKSGTLNSVATLAGILPDRTYFVLLNQGWDLETIRALQDQLLREVLQVSVDPDSPQVNASH
ncbi:MAG: D-alanyl-D-alanine carboxypeptidase [Synechococcus sp.]